METLGRQSGKHWPGKCTDMSMITKIHGKPRCGSMHCNLRAGGDKQTPRMFSELQARKRKCLK